MGQNASMHLGGIVNKVLEPRLSGKVVWAGAGKFGLSRSWLCGLGQIILTSLSCSYFLKYEMEIIISTSYVCLGF